MPFKHKHTNYSRIDATITIGTNFCCTIHFNKNLLKQGITTDISLEEMRIDTPFGVTCYLWLPVRDHTPPSPYQLLVGVSCIENAVKAKQKIYVHCENGHGRAPTLVAAYYITKGMSVEKAIIFLKSKRTGIYIRPAQVRALKQFKKMLLK